MLRAGIPGTTRSESSRTATTLAIALTGLLLGSACTADSPPVEDDVADDDGVEEGTPYADFVVGWTEGGEVMTCADEGAVCGAAATTCGPAAVVGAPDSSTFSLEPSGVLEVALRCSYVLELGGENSQDLKLWGTFGDGVTVQVSLDSSAWSTLGTVSGTDPTLDLAAVGLDTARFIRLSNRGADPATIDAVEALR
jgi:hypothetical protein